MKKLNIFLVLTGFVFGTGSLVAQSGITVEASQLYSSFRFLDSQEVSMNSEYSGKFVDAFSLGYRFISPGGLIINAGAGLQKAGATTVYDDMNYNWDLQYANLKLGAGYMLKKAKASPYLSVAAYYALLLQGFQTINNEDFDIKEAGMIQDSDFGITINPGVQLTISSSCSTYLELNYVMGLQNLETSDTQKSSNYAFGLTFGFAVFFGKE